MPKYWSEEFDFFDGSKRYYVSVKPHDFRKNRFFKLIPYPTGARFVVDVEIRTISNERNTRVSAAVRILEPDGERYDMYSVTEVIDSLEETSQRRYLAIKGEYVVDISLLVLDVDSGKSMSGNRRLMTLETLSQDVLAANLFTAGISAILGGFIGAVLALLL